MAPLAIVGPALGQQSGWVDPPARSTAAPAPAPEKPAIEAAKAAPEPTGGPSAAPVRTGAQQARHVEPPTRNRSAHHHAHTEVRRLADTPIRPAPVVVSDARLTDWAGAAQGLAADYLASFSRSGDASASDAPRFYATQVRFHGRTVTLAALMAEKRNFARRWPERRYESRGMRTVCNAGLATCIVRANVAFRAGSPNRLALSQGMAELVLEVNFSGSRPIIVSESSRVLRRGAQAGTLAIPAGKA